MSTPTIIWYPDGGSISSSREDTDIGEELTDLTVTPMRDRASSVSMGGRHSSTVLSAAIERVRIICERFTDEDKALALQSFASHLARGSACGFTRDTAKAWAGYALGTPSRGDTTLVTTGDQWYYAGSASNASGDVMVVEGLGAEGHREYVKFSSISGTTITFQTGLKYSYTDDIVMVRWRDYYPVLYWPSSEQASGRSIITHDRRLNWTLDVLLETDPDLLRTLFSATVVGSGPLLGLTGATGQLTLEDLALFNRAPYDAPAGSQIVG